MPAEGQESLSVLDQRDGDADVLEGLDGSEQCIKNPAAKRTPR